MHLLTHVLSIATIIFCTTTSKDIKRAETCVIELDRCLRPILVLADARLPGLNTKADLDRVCPDFATSILCVDHYSKCLKLTPREEFRKRFKDVSLMVYNVCHNKGYQKELLYHVPCRDKIGTQTKTCFNKLINTMTYIRARHNQPQIVEDTCCSFQKYFDCSMRIVEKTCNEGAASFSQNILNKMSFALTKYNCKGYNAEYCAQKASIEAPKLPPPTIKCFANTTFEEGANLCTCNTDGTRYDCTKQQDRERYHYGDENGKFSLAVPDGNAGIRFIPLN